MKIGKYLIFTNRVRFTFGIHIHDTELNNVNTYAIQISTKEPYWYPQTRRNTLKGNDGVKSTSSISGWLFIYFVKMWHDGK